MEPVYIKTVEEGLLEKKIAKAYDILSACDLCPRRCGVDRHAGEIGICKTGKIAMVSSYSPHFGEEAPLVGSHGSGTIFFTTATSCVFFVRTMTSAMKAMAKKLLTSKSPR